jgi:hypothetical protein
VTSPDEGDMPRPLLTYGPGPTSVSAAGGNGVVLSLIASTNRIGWDGPPVTNWFELRYQPFFLPIPAPGHHAEVAIDSVQVRWYSGIEYTFLSPAEFRYTEEYATTDAFFDLSEQSSYTLVVFATVEGVPVRLSIHVNVLPCLIPEQQPVDSLINDEGVRRSLKMVLDSSPPTGNPWTRRERGGVRMLLPDGSTRDFVLQIKPNDEPCRFYFAGALDGLPGIPILAWHSHPFSPGNASDPLPYTAGLVPPSPCTALASKAPPPTGKVYTAKGGPSDADRKGPMNSGFPHFIIDKTNVYLIDGPDTNQYQRSWRLNAVCSPLGVFN